MAERSPADVTQRDFVRYRLTLPQHALGPLYITVFLLPRILTRAIEGPANGPSGLGPGAFSSWWALSVWVLGAWLISAAFSSSLGITLTPTVAIVHTSRRRKIPWCDVQAVMIESVMGTRKVVICEANGRRTRLRAPISGFAMRDRRFEEKFHTIGRWWLDHRGPDWAPVTQRGWWDSWPTPPGDL